MSATNDSVSAHDSDVQGDVRPDVSVCIVNWNAGEHISRCLDSIYRTRQTVAYEVIIVDNDSHDGSPDLIADRYRQAHLVRNSDNRGFGCANNQAIAVSRGRYCLFLNPDTLLLDQTLDTMVSFMDTHLDAAVATGKVYDSAAQDRIRISFGDSFPTLRILFLNDLVTLTGLFKLFPHSAFIQSCVWTGRNPEREQTVAQVTGAFMCVRRAAFEVVGLFDERFFMYMEETDWCYRFKRAGWQIYYTPTSVIVHIGEGSSRLRTDRDRLYYRSICTYLEKHYGNMTAFLYRLCFFAFLKPLKAVRKIYKAVAGPGERV